MRIKVIAAALASTAVLAVVAMRYWPRPQETKPAPAVMEQTRNPPALSVDDVPHPAVAALLSPEHATLAERLQHLRAVGDRLPQADRLRLLHSIVNEPPGGLTPGAWHSLANDIMEALRRQKPFTPEYTDHLVNLWLDRDLDPTLRDYALQHLREWVADGDTRTVHEERPEKLELIHRTFLEAVTPGHPTCDPQSTTTGTALLALDEWIQDSSFQLFSVSAFQDLLLAQAGDPAVHRGVRATALQLCARREIRAALPAARAILADPAADAILRIAAISCLGDLGTADDLALLSGFQKQNTRDPLLQASLHKAIQSLSKP